MNQRYKFTEQDIEIISKARADNHNDRAEIRLFALQLRAEGMQAKEIAQIAGVSAPYVSQLVAKYFKGGIEAIAGNHYGGNQAEHISQERMRHCCITLFWPCSTAASTRRHRNCRQKHRCTSHRKRNYDVAPCERTPTALRLHRQ